MAECPHKTRTSMYFDGALPASEQAEAVEHLATCAECQAHSRDAVTFNAILSEAPQVAVRATRRRWPLALGGVALAAAAVLAIVLWKKPAPHHEPPQVALVLPKERAIEARFTGDQFAAHRPFGALRGEQGREQISLETLALLEKRHASSDLVAALAATGDLARANELAGTLADDPKGESDRAAVALAAGDSEQALVHAYRAIDRDPTLLAAWWNLALAARARALPHVARDAFSHVAAGSEPGWAAEAKTDIEALDHDLARAAALSAFTARAQAMLDGGAPITVDDVRAFPMQARAQTLDAIRLRSGPALEPLRAIASELDAAAKVPTMTGALDRAKAAAPATRARFADAYRSVLAGTNPDVPALLAKLAGAGHDVDDIRAGAIMRSGHALDRIAELAAIVAPWHDPWFDLEVTREQLRAKYPLDDLRAEPALLDAIDHCTGDTWAVRCGQLAYDLAERLTAWGREQDAERWSAQALERYRTAGSPASIEAALAQLADVHRHVGRSGVARAEFEELLALASGCDRKRFAWFGLANLALVAGDWPRTRAALTASDALDGCGPDPDIIGVATAVDLARHTADAGDIQRAKAALEAANTVGDGGLALVGTLRIARGSDPAAAAAVQSWLQSHATVSDRLIEALRAWAVTTLVDDAGRRGDWTGAMAAATEHPPAGCALFASYDDGALTVVATNGTTPIGEHRDLDPATLATATIVSPTLLSPLRGCPSIAVVARPPLHGRADLLPPELPWAFVGDTPPHALPDLAHGRSLEVSDARPPDPALAPLVIPASAQPIDVHLTGPDATPSRVSEALATTSYAELHVHGIAAASNADATYLALSPDRDGTFALRADAVSHAKLRGSPIIVLAACRAAVVAPHLRQRWSLPDAFLHAGASAVIAADVAISNASARAVFDELHRRLATGETPEAAVAAVRAKATGDTAWAAHLLLFR